MKYTFLLLFLTWNLVSFSNAQQRGNSTGDDLRPTSEELNNQIKMEIPSKDGVKVPMGRVEYDHMNRAFVSFLGILKHVVFFGVGGGPVGGIVGNGVGAFSGLILDAYLRGKGSGQIPIWDQVKEKVENAIQRKLTIEHFNDILTEFSEFPVLFRQGENFDETQLVKVTKLKHEVFPQGETENIDFSPHWAPTIICWLMHIVAGYLDIRRYNPKGSCRVRKDNNCLGECALAEELVVIRHEIIQAIQTMYRRRYVDIKGVNYGTASSGNQLSLQFEDTAAGVKIPQSFSRSTKNGKHVKREILDPLIKDVHDVSEAIRTNFNQYVDKFEEAKIFEGCDNKPTKIPKFFSAKYNTKFYGTAKGGESPCVLPCDEYGEGEGNAWCPNEHFLDTTHLAYGSTAVAFTANYASCDLPNFDKLIPTLSNTLPAWLDGKIIPAGATNSEPDFKDDTFVSTAAKTEISFANNVIEPDGQWGEWGPWSRCGEHSYAIGFQEKNDNGRYKHDESGVAGIGLLCDNGKNAYSSSSNDGSWADWQLCPYGYNGVKVAVNNHFSLTAVTRDWMGVLDVLLRCKANIHGNEELQTNHDSAKQRVLDDSGTERSRLKPCPEKQLICGIRTKVHDPSSGDEMGVTNIKFECCSPPVEYYQL